MFYGFLHIRAWGPCWLCVQLNKFKLPILPGCCIWNMIETGPAVWEKKLSENVDKHSIPVTFTEWPWPLAFTQKSILSYQRLEFFWIIFPHSKSQETKFDLDKKKKMGQGQPRVAIWTNLVVLSHMLLHTKFPANLHCNSGEEDFLRFLPYMATVAILVIKLVPFEIFLIQPSPGGCTWNLIKIGPAVSEEELFGNVDKHSFPVTLGQGHWMTLTFCFHTGSWNPYFHIKDYHCFGKMQCFTFPHSKSQGTKFDLDKKKLVKVNLRSPFEQTW